MCDLEMMVEQNLTTAQNNGRPYLMFVHGWSTSRPGKTTARSVVRNFMRSKAATLAHHAIRLHSTRNGIHCQDPASRARPSQQKT
jgi:hypothetical protein